MKKEYSKIHLSDRQIEHNVRCRECFARQEIAARKLISFIGFRSTEFPKWYREYAEALSKDGLI